MTQPLPALPARFDRFRPYYVGNPEKLVYHLPASVAQEGEPRFLTVYPEEGRWELRYSKMTAAEQPVETGALS